tara:strand:+ start:4 stop:105 length:102 start_codon:yes stop_codon:yes gene_type:complete
MSLNKFNRNKKDFEFKERSEKELLEEEEKISKQ